MQDSFRILVLVAVIACLSLVFLPVQAELDCGQYDLEEDNGVCVPKASDTKQIDATASEIITRVLNWMLGIVGILSLTMIVYSGVSYVISAGDKERVDSAQKTLTYAIIGLVVSLVAYAIVYTVEQTFGA